MQGTPNKPYQPPTLKPPAASTGGFNFFKANRIIHLELAMWTGPAYPAHPKGTNKGMPLRVHGRRLILHFRKRDRTVFAGC